MECKCLTKSEITLINGDCTLPECYNRITDNSLDIVMFDPPFHAVKQGFKQIRKINKNQLNEISIPKNYAAFWESICKNYVSKIKKTGWFIFKADFHTILFTHSITTKYFDFISDTVWNKKRPGTGYYVRKQHEYILLYRPKKAKNSYSLQRPRKQQLKSTSHGSSKGKMFRSIQTLLNSNGGEFGKKKKNHINQTEVELWKRYLHFWAPSHGNILDLCMGTGSIGKACKMLDLNFTGIEIDKENFEIANLEINKIQRSEKITQFFK
ncbi:MAG: DNA methyltransferase [Promethearchaeota archaeon]